MSTPDRSTLAQRMEQARVRTVAARIERGGLPAALPAAPAPPPLHLAHRAAHAPQAHPTHHPHPAPGPHWQVPARAGEHLVLMPGQMHFGHKAASLRTLLGSCVAVTLWHPTRHIGGMCHYLLPTRTRKAGDATDGRYGDEALEAMVQQLRKAHTEPQEYHAHLYGGADTMPEGTHLKFNVGERNIEQGWGLIDRYGFQLQGVDVGEDVPRTVTLTLASGEVQMRRGSGHAPPLQLEPQAAPPALRRHHG
jgi:chemotaxis protein CheD